jgi:predicted nucleic-acid-binding protein
MIVADTNVWARALLNDDATQAHRARKALADARSQGGIFVPLVVLAELAWVLRAKWDVNRVVTTLEGMLRTGDVFIESPALAHAALEATKEGRGGFADHLIGEVGFANGAQEILTFDEKFARSNKVRRLK